MSKEKFKDMLNYIKCGCDGDCHGVKTEIILLIQAVAKGDYVHKGEFLDDKEIRKTICHYKQLGQYDCCDSDDEHCQRCIAKAKALFGRIRKPVDRDAILGIVWSDGSVANIKDANELTNKIMDAIG